jgi:hypothetical protein
MSSEAPQLSVGTPDITPVYDFRPQLDESIRYTWAEETRDEVLARLLELNRVMAAREAEEAAAKAEGRCRRPPPSTFRSCRLGRWAPAAALRLLCHRCRRSSAPTCRASASTWRTRP